MRRDAMKIKIQLIIAFLILILVFASCKGNENEEPNKHVNNQGDDDTQLSDDDTEAGTIERSFDVVFEYRNNGHISWVEKGDRITATSVKFGDAYGYGNDLVPPNVSMNGVGKILRFPESRFELHTLYFQGPAIPKGPCGSKQISYALTLTGQEGASERYGGIAAYCGGAIQGKPARLLRIYGIWK